MSSLFPSHLRRPVAQAGLVLLASATVGFAYNALNPAGIRFPASKPTSRPAYRAETISATLEASRGKEITSISNGPARLLSSPADRKTTAAVASRTTWEQARQSIERGEAVLVDSRAKLAFEAGHIPGAVNLPLEDLESGIAQFTADHPPAGAKLIIYCSNDGCPTSSRLASLLTQNYGYRDIQYVAGGYLEWLRTKTPESP